MSKDRVAAFLWGDRADRQARASLRQALRELRTALNETHEVICSDREHIWICEHSFSDDSLNDSAQAREAFEDLDNVTPEFDDWLVSERSRRAAARVAALKAEAEELLANGFPSQSTLVADRILRLDGCNEDALRLGMKAEFEAGHPSQIARLYEAAAAALKNELGVEPAKESRDLRDTLLTQLSPVHEATGARFAKLYEGVERALNIGAWECNLLTDELYWTPGTFLLLEIPIGAALSRADILELYEPQSRHRLELARGEAIRNGSGFAIEVDVTCGAAIRKRLLIKAEVEIRDGIAIRIFGTKELLRQAGEDVSRTAF